MEFITYILGLAFPFTFNPELPILTLFLVYLQKKPKLIIYFVIGTLFTLLHQWQISPKNMPTTDPIPNAIIQGTISSIPKLKDQSTQFTFTLDTINNKPAQAIIQLSWYQHPLPVQLGERWQFSVKLKKPRNFSTIGSYDYTSFLHAKHIHWTGYIKSYKKINPTTNTFNWLAIRNNLSDKLNQIAPDKATAGIVEALTLNITKHIDANLWELFRRTGTIHLFGISGEHIALVSGFIFFIIRNLWCRIPYLCLRIPAMQIAAWIAFAIATGYALLAGFEPPVQRALIGCFFYCVYCIGRQRFTSWQMWRYACVGVLCLEPHALFHQGFYFSFLAVACILLTQQRWQLKGYRLNLAIQLACLIGLMPLCLFWYGYGSINSYIANLIAIPLVGLCIVPLALLALIVCHTSWAFILMKLLSWLVFILLTILNWVEHLSFININYSLNSLELTCALMGGLLLALLFPIKPIIPIAILWLILPFLPIKPLVQYGQARINVLDVGQGLAIAVHTKHHVLLYDTGDQFFSGNDLGKLVVLPYLAAHHIKNLNMIVLSHPDKDHRGGLKSISETLPVEKLLVNDPNFYHKGLNCHQYPQWEWDGVRFRFLPIFISPSDRNNSCCVLKITSTTSSILFTGDIEKKAELYLIRHYKKELQAQALVIPHHGSKTSSTPEFLRAVSPEIALISLGFDNKFHFPHAQTVTNLAQIVSHVYRTDTCGMIELILPNTVQSLKPKCYR